MKQGRKPCREVGEQILEFEGKVLHPILFFFLVLITWDISYLYMHTNGTCTRFYTHMYAVFICWFFPCYQFSSVAQSCPTVCNPMNHSTPGLPVHHQFPEFTQTHVYRVRDAIQPSHPLSSPSPAPSPSQHQGLFLTKLSVSECKSLQVQVFLLCPGRCKEILWLCGAQWEERGRAWAMQVPVNLGTWDFRFYSQMWQDIVGFWIGE